MTPHRYRHNPGNVCDCGLTLYHEAHFGGSRGAAAQAFQEEQKSKSKKNTTSPPHGPPFATVKEADAWLAWQETERKADTLAAKDTFRVSDR